MEVTKRGPFTVRMMPGQEPYTEEELNQLFGMIQDACEAEDKIPLDELEAREE